MPVSSQHDQLFGVTNGDGLGGTLKNAISSCLHSYWWKRENDRHFLESKWRMVVESKYAKNWLPELKYFNGWTFEEILMLVVVLLLTCSWYVIRTDRKERERSYEQEDHYEKNEKDKRSGRSQNNEVNDQDDKKQENKKKNKNTDLSSRYSILQSSIQEFRNKTTIPTQFLALTSIVNDTVSTDSVSSCKRILQTMAMFSCSLAFVMPGSLCCWFLVAHFGVFLPYHVFVLGDEYNENENDDDDDTTLPSWYKLRTASFCLFMWCYMIYSFFIDTSPSTGNRKPWLRRLPTVLFGGYDVSQIWWNAACDYLPVVLVKTANLPPTTTVKYGSSVFTTPTKYVMGYHPHGIIAVGAFCAFATDGARTLDVSPKSTNSNDDNDDDNDDPTEHSQHSNDRQQRGFSKKGRKKIPLRLAALKLLEEQEAEKKKQQKHGQRGFSSLFPNLDRKIVTLPINFTVPFIRDYFIGMGALNSNKETFRNYLNLDQTVSGETKTNPLEGRAMIVVVGGAKESMLAHSHKMELVLQHRRGFVREAIMADANLVPVLGFGETNLYTLYDNEEEDNEEDNNSGNDSIISKIQQLIKNTFGVAVPLFTGRSIFFKSLGVMPRRQPVVVVVGKPIPPPTYEQLGGVSHKNFQPLIDRQTDEPQNKHGQLLKEWHTKYVTELEELYQNYKDAKWNRPGTTRHESMRIVR